MRAPGLTDILAARGDTCTPAAWAGIWSGTNQNRDCVTDNLLGSVAEVDTLCTNSDVTNGLQLTCSGTTTDTAIDITCSGSPDTGIPGCTVVVSWSLHATRSGATLHAVLTNSNDYTGCPIGDSCTKHVLDLIRIAAEPASCSAPVEPGTWGRTKSSYR